MMAELETPPDETVEITTLLGKGSRFDGKLSFTGTVRIDGEFVGEIASDDILVVGSGALVKADMDVGTLIVEGIVEGTITARRAVEIHSPGRVRGSITTPSLFIDRGVVFEGNCHVVDPNAPATPGLATPPAGPTA